MKNWDWKPHFAPDGGGGTGVAAGAQAAAGGSGDGVNQGSVAEGPQARSRKNPLAGVVYGKQAQPEGQQTDTADGDRAAMWESLKTGDYADLYKQDLNEKIRGRVGNLNKEIASQKARLEQQSPVIELLMKRYGITDAAQLHDAVRNDEDIWRGQARDRGETWESARDSAEKDTEYDRMKAAYDQMLSDRAVGEQMQKWQEEAQALKGKFPDFDFDRELESNQEFQELVQGGMDLERAYKVTHLDEILNNSITYAAQTVRRQVADDIRANGMRPVENGLKSGPGVIAKTRVKDLSGKDVREIERRVLRGERISF